MIRYAQLFLVPLLVLAAAVSADAGTLSGTVRNGTTGALVPHQDVILIQLQGGMQSAGTFKTDAQGRYSMDHPAIGQAPVLVRVQYRGVNYHQNVPPGTTTADIEVFDSTTGFDSIHVFEREIVIQPNGATLLVGEQFSLHNNSKPPVAVFKEDGTFLFDLPPGAELGQVSAAGPSGMPLVQGTIDKGNGRFAVAYPLRPGETKFLLSYQLPYASNAAKLQPSSPYASQRVLVLVPTPMTFEGRGFAPAGSSQGFNMFVRESVPADSPLEISVTGTAPPPSDTADSGSSSAAPEAGAAAVLPGRLDNLKWTLLGGLAALFALGVIFLLKRPLPQAAVAGPSSPKANPSPAPPRAMSEAVAEVNRSVTQRLEEIKDLLFRLELRRQAGTISEEDYALERARAEKTLRDLLH
jgi:hypothetical protein